MATQKITGKSKKRLEARVVSVKLRPQTIAQLKRKAAAENTTSHAIMREAILSALAA